VKKKCLLLMVAFTICGLVGITPASATLIDFETYPSGTSTLHDDHINTQFSTLGISLISSENDYGNSVDALIAQYDYPWINYASGISALAPWRGNGSYYPGRAQAPIHVYFSTPVNFFSVVALDVGYNGLVAAAYDQYSSLLSSVTIDGRIRDHTGQNINPSGQDVVALSSQSDIYSISIFQQHTPADGLGPEGYLLDNMAFSPVPEPATIILISSGLVGLVGFRRKLTARRTTSDASRV
jgi:hypothetical protein